jgi:hypothetical protein
MDAPQQFDPKLLNLSVEKQIKNAVAAERKRWADLADRSVIGIRDKGAGAKHSEEFRSGCIAMAEWLRDAIREGESEYARRLEDEIGRLREALATCRELREYDRKDIERLREALAALIADIEEYERINNLAPNPGKPDCWQSVTRAKAVLAGQVEDGSG